MRSRSNLRACAAVACGRKPKAGGYITGRTHCSFETGQETEFRVVSRGLLHADGDFARIMFCLTVFEPQKPISCPVQDEVVRDRLACKWVWVTGL